MIPALAINAASQVLSSLMSALSSTSSSSSSSTTSASTMAMSGCTPAAKSGSNALTGSAAPQLSGDMLTTLMALQQQNSAASGASGITESQMSSAASPAQQAPGAHHHHHKMGERVNQPDSVASNLLQALDTNDDSSVSPDELTSFVTANGGTSAAAASDFSALDTRGSGALTSADFAKAWENMQARQTPQSSGSMIASLLDAFSKAGAASASTNTVSVSA